MPALIPQIIPFANSLISQALQPGDLAVDATAGNGNDTLHLARLVGAQGLVHAFDVQADALDSSRRRLEQEGLEARVVFHQTGHEHMQSCIPATQHGAVKAVMFNLGYLPGSDKQVITHPETTLPALRSALELLAPGGGISVLCYTGHPGGADEAEQVERWCRTLDFAVFRVLQYGVINKQDKNVRLLFIERVK